jgi:hypothetical protein
VDFRKAKPQERVKKHGFFYTVLEVSYMGHNGDMHLYVGVRKGKVHTPRKSCRSRLYSRPDFPKFVCSCIYLCGPLSLFWEP